MKVVICGAGIAGLALANRLSARGDEVVLVEQAPGPRTQGYMIDFFGPGYDAAEAMGLLPAIREHAYPVEEMALVDHRGRQRASLATPTVASGRLLSLMRPDLEEVLREALPEAVDLRFGTRLTGVEDLGERVRVDLGGEVVEADLLVGADGIHSAVRELVFGPEEEFLRYLGLHTAAFVFDAPEIRTAVGGRFCLTDTYDREMGFYALRDGRVAAFGVHRTADPALPADRQAAVREAYRDLGWVVPRALRECPAEDVYYDQVAQVHLPTWSSGRVVLLGDSCYAVSLLAGQGASLAVAGAYVLADRLARADSVPAALADYERLWRPVAEEKQETGRNAARWFLPGSRLQLLVRRATLLLTKLPLLNRYIAGQLGGKSTALITNLRASEQSPVPIEVNPDRTR
ncbi:FAD-dependent oxidoreductase [Saccharopolyspora griseoalba]|uniref:FAD-dependent oxidoreductase n=1 Tax=Saccharopolyspora griseoalba TaxID=1431848 RepID=A0ABW2LPG9_9PSEU